MSLIRHQRRTFLLCKETGMQKWTGMLVETGKAFEDPPAMSIQMRGLRLLEIATFNDRVLANTFCHHKASRRGTWHSPNGQHHNQIDYILVRKRFRSGVNIARTRIFSGADIWSDQDLLMMTFHLRLKKSASQNTQDSSLLSKNQTIPMCWKPSKLWQAGRLNLSPSWIKKMQTWTRWLPPSTQQWLKQPVRFLANTVRRRNPGSLQILLICATKRENWEKNSKGNNGEKKEGVGVS